MTFEGRRAEPTPEEITSATLVTTDDAVVFRCTLRLVGWERPQWRWVFAMVEGDEHTEHIGPPWFAATPIELGAIVSEWWESRKRFAAGEIAEQLRDRIARDVDQDK
jgi:hypothetical protein